MINPIAALWSLPLGRLALAALAALLVAGLLAIPQPERDDVVSRPTRPTVVAALGHGQLHTVTGRIVRLQARALVLRMLLGTRKVVEIRRTRYSGSGGAPLVRSRLKRGDRVRVTGYLSGSLLLAVALQDTSRR